MSSSYHWRQWPARDCIDGNQFSLCATRKEPGAWLSIEVGSGSRVDYVSVLNRADNREYMSWLSPFEVWVGRWAGDVSSASAARCGEVQDVETAAGPFMVNCNGAVGSHVTLRLAGDTPRYLTVAELYAYSAT